MPEMPSIARPVTHGPLYHWFGYYDMPVWDATGRYLLSLEVDFQDRPPTADDLATIGMTDLHSGEYIRLSQTRAFNWQQGAMMHWLPTDPARSIIFNDRIEGRFVSVIMDVLTGERRVLGRATSDVGLSGKLALGLNFARIAATRPGYGYAGLPDPHRAENIPADDGVYAIDLSTGRDGLVASMRDAWEALGRPEEMLGSKVWFNHTLLNPSETRLVFLMRWAPQGARTWRTLMFVADAIVIDIDEHEATDACRQQFRKIVIGKSLAPADRNLRDHIGDRVVATMAAGELSTLQPTTRLRLADQVVTGGKEGKVIISLGIRLRAGDQLPRLIEEFHEHAVDAWFARGEAEVSIQIAKDRAMNFRRRVLAEVVFDRNLTWAKRDLADAVGRFHGAASGTWFGSAFEESFRLLFDHGVSARSQIVKLVPAFTIGRGSCNFIAGGVEQSDHHAAQR